MAQQLGAQVRPLLPPICPFSSISLHRPPRATWSSFTLSSAGLVFSASKPLHRLFPQQERAPFTWKLQDTIQLRVLPVRKPLGHCKQSQLLSP